MKTPNKIKVGDTEYKIFVSADNTVITYPQSITLQDSIEEMLEDIGEYDIEYLKDVYRDNDTFCIS